MLCLTFVESRPTPEAKVANESNADDLFELRNCVEPFASCAFFGASPSTLAGKLGFCFMQFFPSFQLQSSNALIDHAQSNPLEAV